MSLRSSVTYPVEIVFHPDWWFHREGITFDADFFYHPNRRVEVESAMERALWDRWGRFGIGGKDSTPQIGAVHLAAGFLLQEMLGCHVEYLESAPPLVHTGGLDAPILPSTDPFHSPSFKRFDSLVENLQSRYRKIQGDVNWGGVLNIAMDLRGQDIFTDLYDRPREVQTFFSGIADAINTFTKRITSRTGTTSISVNRIVRHFNEPVFLHSECSHTMIPERVYDEFLFGFDAAWNKENMPFGIHYCGTDPHRFAASFARLPHLDFLDLGWGGDVAVLRKALPDTFFSIRISPTELGSMSAEAIAATVGRLAEESGNPHLTGFCCVNMDRNVQDETIDTLLESVGQLRSRVHPSA